MYLYCGHLWKCLAPVWRFCDIHAVVVLVVAVVWAVVEQEGSVGMKQRLPEGDGALEDKQKAVNAI